MLSTVQSRRQFVTGTTALLSSLAFPGLGRAAEFPTGAVTTLDGRKLSGQIQSVSGEKLTLSAATGSTELPVSELLAVKLSDRTVAPKLQPGSGEVVLKGGSKVICREFSASGANADLVLDGENKVQIPRNMLARLRLFQLDAQYRSEWEAILGRMGAVRRDVLVSTKSGKLSLVEVPIVSVTPTHFSVLIDEDTHEGKRGAALGGFLFGGGPARNPEALPLCKVHLVDGSIWNASTVAFKDDTVELKSVEGVTVTYGVSELAVLDYSISRLLSLQDLAPDRIQSNVYQAGFPDAALRRLAPNRDATHLLGKAPFLVGGKRYDQGVRIVGGTNVHYLVERKYTELTARGALQQLGDDPGEFEIIVDGKQSRGFRQQDDGTFELKLDLTDAYRFRISSRGPIVVTLGDATLKRK